MTPSPKCIALVKQCEGLRLAPYRDVAGIFTIGWGHVLTPADPHLPITEDHAEGLLLADLSTAAQAVERLVRVPLTQGQYDALVDFVFNLGSGHLAGSTLLELLNAGDYDAVPAQLAKWTFAGGRVQAGLVTRRQMECELWETVEVAA